MRKTKFVNNEYYHIYNRGVDKRDVFMQEKDYARFLRGMREFNNEFSDAQRDYERRKNLRKLSFGYPKLSFLRLPKFVDIVCYCLNQNHYHFILKQLMDSGIEKFMHKIGIGYTKFFNKKYDRSGSLFQGTFKSIHINTNEYLLWLSGYVNGNAEIHKIAEDEDWQWGSCKDYFGLRDGTLCNKEIILDQFSNLEEYKKFVIMAIKESRKRKDLEKYLLE